MKQKRKTYRIDPAPEMLDSSAAATAHLLAEADSSLLPFVLTAEENSKAPTITKISTQLGDAIYSEDLWAGILTCVNAIEHVVLTSDGQSYTVPLHVANCGTAEVVRHPTGQTGPLTCCPPRRVVVLDALAVAVEHPRDNLGSGPLYCVGILPLSPE